MKLYDIAWLVASGGLWFDGLGWWWEKFFIRLGWMKPPSPKVVRIIKTLTLPRRKGNLKSYWPMGCIRFIHSHWEKRPAWQRWLLSFIPFGAVGVNNSVGLTNQGFTWWLKKIWPKIKNRKDLRIIISLFGTPDELVAMIEIINILSDPNHVIVGIQINGACPNSGEDLSKNADTVAESCQRAAKISRFPLSLSVSVAHDIDRIVAKTRDVIELYTINSVPWVKAFGDLKSPLKHLGNGGVSGKVVQDITWALAERLEELGVDVAWPSVWELSDPAKIRAHGKRGRATTISAGSAILCHPFRSAIMLDQDQTHGR